MISLAVSACARCPGPRPRRRRSSAAALEELHRPLVAFGSPPRGKRPEVPSLAGAWVLLPRVESVLPRLELSDHHDLRRDRVRGAAFSATRLSRYRCCCRASGATGATADRHQKVTARTVPPRMARRREY